MTTKVIKSENKKVIKKQNQHLTDMRNLFVGIGKIISKADISFKVDNFEAKKDKENNMQFSMVKENFRTDVNIKSTGAISVETNTKG